MSGTLEAEGAHVQGGFHARSFPGYFCRSRITETCAIVKESIAPNEYSVARRSVSPGIRVIAATAEKTRIAM